MKLLLDYIRTGATEKLLTEIKKNPKQLNNIILTGDVTGFNLLFSMLATIQEDRTEFDKKMKLAECLNYIVNSYSSIIDYHFTDLFGNTILHRIFLHALQSKNEEVADKLIDIGCKILECIRVKEDISVLINKENMKGLSFLENLEFNFSDLKKYEVRLNSIRSKIDSTLNGKSRLAESKEVSLSSSVTAKPMTDLPQSVEHAVQNQSMSSFSSLFTPHSSSSSSSSRQAPVTLSREEATLVERINFLISYYRIPFSSDYHNLGGGTNLKNEGFKQS